MTEQEAVGYMENEIRCIQKASYCNRDCSKCELVKEEEPLLESYGLAIYALEKQIPKKPIRCVGFNESLFICPACGRKQAMMYEQYHCKSCGQKLGWEGE